MKDKKSLDLEKWALRLCALAFVSGIHLTVSANEKGKNDFKRAVATSTCAVLGGVGMGMAYRRLGSCEKERG